MSGISQRPVTRVTRPMTCYKMADDIQIKQFQLSDQEAVLAFLRIAYSDDSRKSDPAFWNWHHLENPYTSLDDVPLWIARNREFVVGQVAAISMELNVGGTTQRAIWVVDLVVLKEYRGRGLGKRLMLAARNSGPPVGALGYNELSGPILTSLRWTPLGSMSRRQKLLFPGHAAKEISGIWPLRNLMNLFFGPFRPRTNRFQLENRYAVFEVSDFDEAFDDLWKRASRQWPCSVTRSSRFLEWQFKRQPGKNFEVLGLRDGSKLAGYVVLFFRKPDRGNVVAKAALTDICYDASYGPDLIVALLETALAQAVKRRAGALVTDILDLRVDDQLEKLGFWKVRPRASFMVYDPRGRAGMYEPKNWFLTRADSDVSIFEGANL